MLLQAENQPLLPSVSTHLHDMSAVGYRTLVIAYKDLNPAEFSRWAADYKDACSALDNREAKVAVACEVIEQGLTLLGATAVEDKLQVGCDMGNWGPVQSHLAPGCPV